MPTRRWRVAVGALCVFAFGALSSVGALAQQDAKVTARTAANCYGTFTPGIHIVRLR